MTNLMLELWFGNCWVKNVGNSVPFAFVTFFLVSQVLLVTVYYLYFRSS